MKFRLVRLGLARSLVALSVSLAVVLSTHAFAFSSFAQSRQSDSPQSEFRLIAASANATAAGVLIQWRTNESADNLGFNVYRLQGGRRTRVNRELIPGAAFSAAGAAALMRAGYSYSWFDRGGTSDSSYYLESVGMRGATKIHEAISPSKTVSGLEQMPETLGQAGANATESTDSFLKGYPAAESEINAPVGALADQWAIAGQAGLKIGIKKDGWYRVTQAQMAAAGFNPSVDIRNLRLFVEAQEVAINTSQYSGPFGSSDYLEFYGRGLDTLTTDTRTYYLIAGTTPGKRVRGENQLNDAPPVPPPPRSTPTPTPTPVPVSSPPAPRPTPQSISIVPPSTGPVLLDHTFFGTWIDDRGSVSLDLKVRERNNASADSGGIRVNLNGRNYPPDNSQPEVSQPGDTRAASQEQSAGAVGSREQTPAAFANVARNDSVASNNTVPKASNTVRGSANKTGSVSRPVRTPTRSRKLRMRAHSKTRKSSKVRRPLKFERNHAVLSLASAPANFQYTAERKDRTIYFFSLRNGDEENFFGQVITNSPGSQTITTPNPDLTAAGTAKLEVAMQGATFVDHQVNLKFNDVLLGAVLPSPPQSVFFGRSHVVATFDVPVSLLRTVNTLTFTPSPSSDTTLVDYTRLTYPHQFRYDNPVGNIHLVSQPDEGDTLVVGSKTYTFKFSPTTNLHIGIGVDLQTTAGNIANRINLDTAATLCTAVSYPTEVALTANPGGSAGNSITLNVDGFHLQKTVVANLGVKFSLRGTQSVMVDGFAMPSVRLIDYTDPLAVSISRPPAQPSALGFAITIPTSDPPSKPPRLLYAIPDGQFDQPASLSLNQPSNLNQGVLSQTITSGADFLVVSHKNFIGSLGPLLSQRQSQGKIAAAVDVEDIYDEFSYGVHGPQAIKDFLAHALTHWTTPPRYVVFVGDASYDPRSYQGLGNFDLVPTKLIDDNYTETVSDDWLADSAVDLTTGETDGIADIPIGRIPVRTTAEADLVVSKIVNYSPAPVPQTAILIADDPVGGFDFEQGNDNVQALLPASMTVQRVNVRTVGATQATIDIRNGITDGRAIVNYSGHGNIDVWSSQSIWRLGDASGLANGMNKLTFVVVMDCLNGYYQDPSLLSLSEAFLKAPNGGAVAAFASSGLTTTPGQRQMELEFYRQLYGAQPIALGDAIKIAKAASDDRDVRTTWIFFGDPSIKIR